MLTRLNARMAVALTKVKHDDELKAFFARELAETERQLVTMRDDVALRHCQGKAQYLVELLDLVEKSTELAGKLAP